MPRRIVIFGAGKAGERALRSLSPHEEVIAFMDNDPEKQGTEHCGIKVVSPAELSALSCDCVRIASDRSREIYAQLLRSGWPEGLLEIDYSPSNDKLYEAWKRNHSHRLEVFRDCHRGEDCFILGNGPSLAKMDLSPLNRYRTFGLNKIHLIFSRSEFRPSYHVAINPLVVAQSRKDFERLGCPSFLPIDQLATDEGRDAPIYYINAPESQAFSGDATVAVCQGSTVTYAAMQIAWFMGFQNVYLIGVDHSFTTIGEPNEKQRMGPVDSNHFDPDYFANQDWQLPDLEGSEFSYLMAKKNFESSRPPRCIWDATVGGKLNLFPKLGYEEALARCRPWENAGK